MRGIMVYKELSEQFDLQRVNEEINEIATVHGWWNDSQISLQSPNGDFMYGNGNLNLTATHSEEDFITLNIPDHFEIARFIQHYGLYRTRIMKLNPKIVYSMHTDRSSRIHLPVITNPNCMMIINGNLFHMPATGHAYFTQTVLPHTAFNANMEFFRYHIVGCVKEHQGIDDFV